MKANWALLLSIVFLLASGCLSKSCSPSVLQSQEPLDFTNSFSFQPSYKKDSQELSVQISLKNGFHAYGLGETIGRPVTIKILPTRGWQLVGEPNLPKGETKDLGQLGKSVVLNGSFNITAKVLGGEGPIDGALQLQICTDSACDRPREHSFSVPVL